MVKFQIADGKKVYTANIPENWNEVPEEQYPNLAQIYLKTENRMNEYDKLVRSFCLLTIRAWDGVKLMSDEQLAYHLQHIHWVFGELDLSLNKIPQFSIDGVDYYGPEEELGNLRFGEYCIAEAHFIAYWQHRDEKALDRLIATLYRPKGKGNQYKKDNPDYRGDIREKFNGNLVEQRAEVFADLDLAIRDGIFLFYVSARNILASYYPHVFPKKRAKNTPLGNQQVPNYGWLGVFDDLLGEKGRTAETLEDEFLATTLMSLERSQIKFRDMKRNSKK